MKRAFLPPSLMITSIIGLTICGVYTVSGGFEAFFLQFGPQFENFGNSIGFASCLAFVIMLIAAFVSMTPTDHELD